MFPRVNFYLVFQVAEMRAETKSCAIIFFLHIQENSQPAECVFKFNNVDRNVVFLETIVQLCSQIMSFPSSKMSGL